MAASKQTASKQTGSKQIEIERKYVPGTTASRPDLTTIAGIAALDIGEPVTLVAVYFDTDALDLAAHSIAVRRREGGGDDGWHLKMAVASHGPTGVPAGNVEMHWPLSVGQEPSAEDEAAGWLNEMNGGEVPHEVLEPVRAIVRDRAVTPLARIETVRAAVLLLDEHGMAIAEFADDTVSAEDVRRAQSRSWREWEVELLAAAPRTPEGQRAFFDSAEEVLAAVGAHPSKSHSKLAHALGLSSLDDRRPAKHVHHDRLDKMRPTSAAVVVVRALRNLVVALNEADPAVRVDAPDAVHSMRRITRQLRSALATYGRLFVKPPVERLTDDLRWLGRALGEARDAEVRSSRAANELESLPVGDPDAWRRLVESDRHEYQAALDRVRQLLLGERYFRLLDALDEFVWSPPLRHRATRSATHVVTRAIRAQAGVLKRRADAAQASDIDRERALHDARKAARRLRYSISVLAEGDRWRPGKKLRAIASAAKPVVASLGAHRDRLLFAEHVAVATRDARSLGEDTFVYGLILGGMNERARTRGDAVLVELNDAESVISRLVRKT